jgi:hypothetical protein
VGGTLVRNFVVGKRDAELASDGNYYSRALQASTTYYFKLTCPATGDSAQGSFTTQTVAIGSTYAEPPPVDPLNPGEYAWPTLSFTDRTQQIIDPQTGVLLRRMSLPQDRVITVPNQSFVSVRTTTWLNAPAALSSADGNQAATITGNDSGTLLLLPQDNVNFSNYISFYAGNHTDNDLFLNWFQVVLNAATSNPSCPGSGSADCNIVVCLTIDGVNCDPNGQQFQQALSTNLSQYTFGTTGTAIDLWQLPGKRPFNGTEVAIRQGQVTCDGSSTVVWAGGDFFPTFWSTNSTITIQGVNYQILQVNTTENLQIQGSCPSSNGQQVSYNGMNFGVLIRKQTASPDTVSVEYASANYQSGIFPFFDYSGAYDLCGTGTVIGPTGNPGYNCSMIQNGQIYWIDGITGEAHVIALNQGVYSSPYTGSCGVFDSIPFDPSVPDVFYCGGNYPQRVQYFGSHADAESPAAQGNLQEGVNLPSCNSSASPTNEPCLLFTNLTGSGTLSDLIVAFDPTFDPNAFTTNILFSHVEDGLLVFRLWRSIYGSLGWTVLFDPNATSNSEPNNAGCVGGGLPGCVVGAVPSWSRPNARWCALKSNDPLYVPGWMSTSPYGWGPIGSQVAGAGPYLSTVNDGTAFSVNLNGPGGPTACPSNSLGVTGDQCTTVNVDAQPYNPTPCTASVEACYGEIESGAPGAIGDVAVGDFFSLGPSSWNSEVMRLVAIDGSSNTQWTFQRAYNNILGTSGSDPQLYTTCNANPNPANVNGSAEWYWNYGVDPHGYNTNGETILNDPNGIQAHFFSENAQQVSSYSLDPRCGADYEICYQSRIYNSLAQLLSEGATAVQETNPAFNGIQGIADGNQVQSHPAGPGWLASPQNSPYFLDGRPFNGGPLSGSGGFNGSDPATPMGGALWKFSQAQVPRLDRKLMPTFAFSGSKALLDVSSPAQGNVITGNQQDWYKYCVANVANECVSGSQQGDVYVNAPFVQYPYCNYPSQAASMPDEYDICIGDNAIIYNSLMQVNGSVTDVTGASQRSLGKGLSRLRETDAFWHAHALANSNWIMFKTSYAQEAGDMIFAMELPPPTTDSVDRTAYQTLTLTTPPMVQGMASAYVEFGYGEYGAPANLYCTSRAEVCAVGQPNGVPFWFTVTEGSQLQPVPCSAGCQVSIPALPQHVVYAQWEFLDANGTVLGHSQVSASAVN